MTKVNLALFSVLRISLLLTITYNFAVAQPTAIFNLFFDLDQDELKEEAIDRLQQHVGQLTKPQAYRAVLIGHTDQQGSLTYNQVLSERRAEQVKTFLIEHGFEPTQVAYTGKAFLDLLVDEDSEEAYARNRRVSVIFERDHRNVPSQYYYLSAQQPAEIEDTRSGTQINIPENAFATVDGQNYEGEVIVQYREFRDFADFMATDLPMNFDGGKRGQYYFNSTGMFELRAFDQEGAPLSLREGKAIDMAFVQSQLAAGSQAWQYNDEKQRWQNGEEEVQFAWEAEKLTVPVDTIERLLDSMYLGVVKHLAAASPTFLQQLNTAYERIPEIIASTRKYSNGYSPLLDGNLFRTRFRGRHVSTLYAGSHYIAHLSPEEVCSNPKYYNIQATAVKENATSITLRFEDLSGENPEWEAFAGVSWKVRKRDLKEKKLPKDSILRNFADIRISHKKRMRHFRLQLKHKGKIHSIPVYWEQMNGKTTKRKERELAYHSYRQALRTRRQEFDQQIAEQAHALNYYLTALKLLLPTDLALNGADLTFMRNAIFGHYIHWKEARMKRYFDDPLGRDPLRLGGRSWVVAQAAYLEKHFLGRQIDQEKWMELLQAYDPRIAYDEVTYVTTFKELGNPVPNFQISTLGIFNFDVLKRFKEEQELMVSFKDESGQLIDYARVEVINHRLNGLLRYKGESIHLDAKSPNTIVVYAKDGRIFYLKAKELQQIDLRNKERYAFTVKDLGDYSAKPALFRDLLRYDAAG